MILTLWKKKEKLWKSWISTIFGPFPRWESTSVPLSGRSCYCYSASRFKSEWFHLQADKRDLPCAKKYSDKNRVFCQGTIFNGQKTKESKRRTFVPSRKKLEMSFFQSGARQDIPKLIRKILLIWKLNGWIMVTFYLSHKQHTVVKEGDISGKQTHF